MEKFYMQSFPTIFFNVHKTFCKLLGMWERRGKGEEWLGGDLNLIRFSIVGSAWKLDSNLKDKNLKDLKPPPPNHPPQ